MKNKLLEAIQKGLSKALNFNIDDNEESDFSIKKSKIDSNNGYIKVYMQEMMDKAVKDMNFEEAVSIYEQTGIQYSVGDDYDLLKDLLKNFNSKKYKGINLNWIDTYQMTNMQNLFAFFYNFDCDISKWDVSNVENMRHMFYQCEDFNCDISGWDVSKVTNMEKMFFCCTSFNQPIGDWDVSNVKNMSGMFWRCEEFDQPLNRWNVSNVTEMSDMFHYCSQFNQPLDNWDVSSVQNFRQMFHDCNNFTYRSSVSNWKKRQYAFDDNMFN